MFKSRFFRSKLFVAAIIATLFLIKILYDTGNYLYFGFRYESKIFSPVELFLGKSYQLFNLFFAPDEPGLPLVHIYLPEKSQMQLLESPPRSTKDWKRGYVAFEGKDIQTAKLRHRGENARNFAHMKKSWKVKVRRRELHDDGRVFNFIVPRGHMLGDIIPYWIAEEISLLTPKARFKELQVNGQYHGISLSVQQLDENFLRSSGLMPVNLYKGEPDGGDGYLGPLNEDLFNSLKGWSKQAVNNAFPKEDRSDIRDFLRLLAKSHSDPASLQALKVQARDEEWVRFAVFQELNQSWHNSRHVNIRLLFDNWRGIVIPIPWDTAFKYQGGEPAFDRGSHEVFDLYMQRSDFLLKKYRLLYRLLKERDPLEKVAVRLEEQEPAFELSQERDAFYQAWTARQFGLFDRREALRRQREDSIAKLRNLSLKLKERLNRDPVATWRPEDSGISLMLDGELPVSELTLSFKPSDATPRTGRRQVWLDLDQDGVFSKNDISLPYTENDREMTIHGSWLANRVVPTSDHFHIIGPDQKNPQTTRFPIRSNHPLNIRAISAQNPLNGRKVLLNKGTPRGVLPAKWNRPITPEVSTATRYWSGEIVIEDDTIVSEPLEIAAGTEIKIAPNKSVVFKNTVRSHGTREASVLVEPLVPGSPWGTFALQGRGTAGSKLNFLEMRNGSGGNVQGIRYTGMFSIHDTRDIRITNLRMERNSRYDDMVHIIFSQDVELDEAVLTGARSDAIDVDISEVVFSRLRITNSGNDALDFMDSRAVVRAAAISGSGDKGISVGEGSMTTILDSQISNSSIGIESKDGSVVTASNMQMESNEVQLSAYLKNWRYGSGGKMHVTNSVLSGKNNLIVVRRNSQIRISDSNLNPRPSFEKPSHEKRTQLDSTVTFGTITLPDDDTAPKRN